MALHYMKLRCEIGHERLIRRPSKPILISRIVARSLCFHCNPDALKDVCAACLTPFSVAPHHARGMCNPCYRRAFYRSLSPERLAAIRGEEMLRSREYRETHARYKREDLASVGE